MDTSRSIRLMKFWHGYVAVAMLNTLVGQLKCQLITNGVQLWINRKNDEGQVRFACLAFCWYSGSKRGTM